MADERGMYPVCEIPAGQYEIGDDGIPNAGPRHVRQLRRTFWIDALPVSWAHFEFFVAGGGYDRRDLWPEGFDPQMALANTSVDGRCRALLEGARVLERRLRGGGEAMRRRAITGLTWAEACALAAFFEARLPHEAEWEVAMNESAPGMSAARSLAWTRPYDNPAISRFGCAVLVGSLEEWTAGVFSPRYWRADRNFASPLPGIGATVVVRGSSPHGLYHHRCYRIGREPGETGPLCGLRRVWDQRPRVEQIQGNWDSDKR